MEGRNPGMAFRHLPQLEMTDCGLFSRLRRTSVHQLGRPYRYKVLYLFVGSTLLGHEFKGWVCLTLQLIYHLLKYVSSTELRLLVNIPMIYDFNTKMAWIEHYFVDRALFSNVC